MTMIDYAVAEISGRQYMVKPNLAIEVDFLGDVKSLDCDKVMLVCEDGRLEIGNPYLKTKLNFEVLSKIQKRKIRIAKFKAKANYRRVLGIKPLRSQIKLKTS